MGNVQLVIEVDVDPATYKLAKVMLYTAGKGGLIREASLIGVKPGTDITWTRLENVWYDIYLQDVTGKDVYWIKGKYLTGKTIVRLSDIIKAHLPASY